VRLLDHRITDRSDELIKMCSWCARIEAGDWVEIEEGCRRLGLLEEPRLPQITHTVCAGCMAAMSDELDSSPGFLPGNRRYFAVTPG
jgi:hypothetical protein